MFSSSNSNEQIQYTIQDLIKSEDLFIQKQNIEYDSSRYNKIFVILFKIGFFILTTMVKKNNHTYVPFTNELNELREQLYSYVDHFYHEGTLHCDLVKAYILFNNQKQTNIQKKILLDTLRIKISEKMNIFYQFIHNQILDKYHSNSKNFFISKVITLYTIYIVTVQQYSS